MRKADKKVIFILAFGIITILFGLLVIGIIRTGQREEGPVAATVMSPSGSTSAPPTGSGAPTTAPPTHPLPSEDDYSEVIPSLSPETIKLTSLAALRLAEWELGQTTEERQEALASVVDAELIGPSPFAPQFESAPVGDVYITSELASAPSSASLGAHASTVTVSVRVDCTIHLPKGDGTETVATTTATWQFVVDVSVASSPKITGVTEPVNP